MTDQPALAIFVKTPGLSPVKTRLAAAVGRDAAEEFYRLSVAAVEAVALEAVAHFGIHAFWAVAEADALEHARWQSFDRIAQGSGGLGERLGAVYRALLDRHPAVLLLGADAPLVSSALISTALTAISRPETPFAISRSADGGYALIAGRRAIPRNVWLDVPYGTAEVARTFISGLVRHGHINELDRLDDVDDREDLRSLAGTVDLRSLNAAQRAVIAFAREVVRGD